MTISRIMTWLEIINNNDDMRVSLITGAHHRDSNKLIFSKNEKEWPSQCRALIKLMFVLLQLSE